MDNFAITAADAVSRRYKSNDPEAIIAQRAIKIKDIRFCEELLGFYTVLLNCEYIGINPNCSKQQRRSALAHELGHAIFDRKHAASGQAFQDTYFYSLSNAKAERRANTFAAELLLSDDDVLKPIGFYEFKGNTTRYAFNAATLKQSTIAWKNSPAGLFVSTDGGKTWGYGWESDDSAVKTAILLEQTLKELDDRYKKATAVGVLLPMRMTREQSLSNAPVTKRSRMP